MTRPLHLLTLSLLAAAACRNEPPARRPTARDAGRTAANAPTPPATPTPTPPAPEPEPEPAPRAAGDAAVVRGPTGPGVFSETLDGGVVLRGNVELSPVAIMSGAERINIDAFNTALRALLPRFRECYRTARVADRAASGSINLTFTLGEDGRVRAVNSPDVPDGAAVDTLPRCSEIALRGGSFPRPQGTGPVEAEVRVGYIPL